MNFIASFRSSYKGVARFSYFTKQMQMKNGFRFENQNLTWTYEEMESQSNAVAYGLLDQGWKQGEKLLLLLGKSNTTESAATFVGAAKAGVVLVPFRSNDKQELESIIRLVDPKGIIFSPNMQFGAGKLIETIQELVPELRTTNNGDMFQSKQFKSLKWLIHTGFYSYPGTYKFRVSTSQAVLAEVHDSNLHTLSIEQLENKYKSLFPTQNENVIIAGDPQTPLAFSAVLGGLQQGYLTILTGSENLQKVNKILNLYPNSSLLLDGNAIDLDKFNLLDCASKNVQNVYVIGSETEAQSLKSKIHREVSSVDAYRI